jgi:hypothetical protein
MGAAKPFVIFALPRSRTAWLSRFLTYGDFFCGHEELRHCRSLDDVKTWFDQPCIGTAETAAAPFWRLLGKIADAKILVVRRPVDEVVESLLAVPGLTFDRDVLRRSMEALDRKLDQIEARLPCLSVRFEDLANEQACRSVFEHCLPYAFDRAHWERWADVNVQCNLPQMYRHFAAYRESLEKLALVAKHRTLADLAAHEPVAPDGITFQVEDFDTWVSDAVPLFREHLIEVGESPENWRAKNIPLMRRIHEFGSMQIMTARCNGRMFGYLMTLIAPSLESEGLTSAVHTTFYASPEFKGLGTKLQRAALKALTGRGVGEVHFQAGVRGSGERIETIYRRLGAEYGGKVFRLKLAEAA